MTSNPIVGTARISSGCAGLDIVMSGGLPKGHLYLLEGEPGSGKTTLALQFVLDGQRNGEKVLYVTLSESRQDLEIAAKSHGLSLEGVEISELLPSEEDLRPESQYTVFHPAEVELNDRMQRIVTEIRRLQPNRLVIDALSELRMLAKDPLRYRRQILSLKDFMTGKHCTVLLLDDRTSREPDLQLHSIVHGVISLDRVPRDYGNTRRQLQVLKLRGTSFREGLHDYLIHTGGVKVFPRLVAAESRGKVPNETVSSGIPELDALTGGGLDRGTSTLLMGPAGSGKTTIALRWAFSAALRNEKSVLCIFEESPHTLITRAAGLGMGIQKFLESGLISLERVDPAEMPPGQLIERVKFYVENRDVKLVVIDSLNGYLQSVPGEQFLTLHLHELLGFLNNSGILTLLTLAQAGTIGSSMPTPVDVSYLADNILLFRYFEVRGEVRQAISAIKKRGGSHERKIRELAFSDGKITVGKPISNFHGVLTGIPTLLDLDPKP